MGKLPPSCSMGLSYLKEKLNSSQVLPPSLWDIENGLCRDDGSLNAWPS